MLGTVTIVNPNSSATISMQIDDAVSSLAGDLGVGIEVVTCAEGPPAIETDEDVAAAVGPMVETALAHPADAYVVACFSDPGITELRNALDEPVFGIAESAVLAAMSRGRTVGIISALDVAIPRHYRYWDRIGVSARIVADIATGRGVLDLESEDAYRDVLGTGRKLAGAGAEAVVLGCTGMTHLRARLQADLGMPVIEPCRAALTLAASALRDASPVTGADSPLG
ncbi:MAG: aspartate/glutamate racemase family protein [bacterium]|nr:aspartate/glutamate racemase family protein [bacterium]MDE0352323.1 aspartate/glutamate racemase family protein [bacterium]